MATFGFIGTGNMGGALARAAAKAVPAGDLVLTDKDLGKAIALADSLRCRADTLAGAAGCDYVFLGVKPHLMEGMLREAAPLMKPTTVLVSMAAGLKMQRIRQMAGIANPIIRIMPNTPASVGQGMILYDCLDATQAQIDGFLRALAHAGRLDRLEEGLIDAASALSGSGPAYVCLFLEALADGGVACGLPRDKALTYAAQTLLGTAQLVLESGLHPGALKDAVCSPGGSTIDGVKALEARAFRAAAQEAVEAAWKKNLELGKN